MIYTYRKLDICFKSYLDFVIVTSLATSGLESPCGSRSGDPRSTLRICCFFTAATYRLRRLQGGLQRARTYQKRIGTERIGQEPGRRRQSPPPAHHHATFSGVDLARPTIVRVLSPEAAIARQKQAGICSEELREWKDRPPTSECTQRGRALRRFHRHSGPSRASPQEIPSLAPLEGDPRVAAGVDRLDGRAVDDRNQALSAARRGDSEPLLDGGTGLPRLSGIGAGV